MMSSFLVRADSDPAELIKTFEDIMQDFAKEFSGYGLDKIEDMLQQQMKKQMADNGIKPVSIFKPGWNSPLAMHAVTEDNALQKRYLNKKEWNQQTFKTNYKAWIQKFTDELKKLKQKFHWLDINALVRPLLEIKWDDVKIHAETVCAAEDDGIEETQFTSKTLYHGSPKPVTKFDVTTGSGRYGNGLYLTPDLDTAKFYAAGGRQGKAGQRVKTGTGYVYEIKVSGPVLRIFDEQDAMNYMASDHEGAEEARDHTGDATHSKATKFVGEWAAQRFGCKIVWVDIKDAGALSPLGQVIVYDKSAIKSVKPLVEKKKKKAVSFLVNFLP